MLAGVKPTKEYTVSNGAINQDDIQNTLAKSKQAVSDNFESNSAVKVISGTVSEDNSKLDALLLVPLLSFIDKFVDRKIGGPQDKSLLNKTAKIGDKISHILHLDNVISEKNTGKISNFLKNNRFTKYFTNDFKANAKSSFAKGQTMAEKYSHEVESCANSILSDLVGFKYSPEIMEHLQNSGTVSADTLKFLKDIGPLKSDISTDYLSKVSDSLKELSSKLGSAKELSKEQKALQTLQEHINTYLSGAGAVSEKGLAEEIASVLKKFSGENIDDILKNQSISLSKETREIFKTVSDRTFSKEQIINVVDDLAQNGINVDTKGKLSELRNKLKASSLEMGETLLGKNLAKGTLKTKDLLTYGGGLISLMFTASAIMQAVKAAKEAPKGEKKSTFMHVLSEQYIGILLFQPCTNLLYKIGGNKYRGMTLEGREALRDLVQKTNTDRNLTKEALKVAKMQRDLLIKGVSKDKVEQLAGKGVKEAKNIAKSLKNDGAKLKFWEKPLKFAGKLLDIGLDNLKKPKFIKLPVLGEVNTPTLKGFLGGLGRVLIIMLIIQPIIQKPITKLCHKLFGEPKTYLEKQNKKSESKNGNKEISDSSVSAQNTTTDNTSDKETNLLRIYENNKNKTAQQQGVDTPKADTNQQSLQQPNAVTPITDNQTNSDSQPLEPKSNEEIPALNLFNKDKKENSSRYIPSIDVDTSYYDKNLKEIEKIVDDALKETDSIVAQSKKYYNK